MSSFKNIDGILHIYSNGDESNVGVFDGVRTVYVHNCVQLHKVFYPGLHFDTITLDDYVMTYKCNIHIDVKKLVVYDASIYLDPFITYDKETIGYYLTDYVNISVLNDIEIVVIDSTFQKEIEMFYIKKGTSRNFMYNLVRYFCYYYSYSKHVYNKELIKMPFRLKANALDFYLTYYELTKNENVYNYLKRIGGRFLNDCFDVCPDRLAIKIIESGFITKQMLTRVLQQANETGRADVAASIIEMNSKATKGKSRFTL